MARVNYKIAHLIHTDPNEAKNQILEALRTEKMHIGNAAHRIGCTHGTLLIWMKKLEMQKAVDKLKATALKEGWHHEERGGRPKMTKSEKESARAAREAAKAAMTPSQLAAAKRARSRRRESKGSAHAA